MMYSTTVAIAVASSLIFHGRGPTRALAASDVGGNSDYEYCVIGAGPAGIQMGLFLEQANRSYVVLERGEGAGTFFKKYPRHRTLISLNKRHTGRGGSALSLEHNLRHDWHSLLTSLQSGEIDERRLFTSWTNKFYPPADKLVEYFQDWADHYALNIQYGTEVLSIRENSGHAGFTLRTQHVNSTDAASPINCKWALAATGLYKGHVPDLTGLAEHSIGYNDISTERSAYTNKSIAIVGAGNAGFETFSDVMEEAAFVHIHSRSSIKFAWETHYVGDVRSINTLPIDNYQLKSQDILHMPSPVGLTKEDTVIEKEVIDGVEKICMNDIRHAEMTKWIDEGATPAGLKGQKTGGHSLTFEQRFTNVDRYCYDVVIRCTGMEVDDSIFQLNKPLKKKYGRADRKYPSITAEYEAEDTPGLYFLGTLAHVRDYRKSSGGFVHGLRYTARALHKWLEQKNHGVPWPRTEVAMGAGGEGQSLLQKLTDRMDTSSGLYQMFGVFGDVAILPSVRKRSKNSATATAQYLEEVPLDLIPKLVPSDAEYLVLTNEYGPDFHGNERVLRTERVFHDFDPTKAHRSQFLHPIIRYFAPGVPSDATKLETAAHHVLEDIYTDFKNEVMHVAPLSDFLKRFHNKKLKEADPPLFTGWPGQGKRTSGSRAEDRTKPIGQSSKDTMPAEDIESMKAKDLKARLKAAGLDTRGTRVQLVERLSSSMGW